MKHVKKFRTQVNGIKLFYANCIKKWLFNPLKKINFILFFNHHLHKFCVLF